MSALSNQFETDLLNLIFLNTAATLIGDAGGLLPSATTGSLYISLHTASPAEAGNQTTNEATYTSYARVAVPRNGSNWTVTGNQASADNSIDFPEATGGSNTLTHFGIGTATSGAGKLLFYGALSGSLAVSANVTPKITALTISAD
jgi:hypothetical protein